MSKNRHREYDLFKLSNCLGESFTARLLGFKEITIELEIGANCSTVIEN